jgi:hypothetical protein
VEYVFTQNQNLLTTNSIKIELSKLHVFIDASNGYEIRLLKPLPPFNKLYPTKSICQSETIKIQSETE